jgi:2-polyprenyl-6-methoxyphenol hydroxylase-like FAD-dependent oxidoreductase
MALIAPLFALMSFDYLIARGGTAGLAVAARLVENPLVNVRFIEARASHINDPTILTPLDVVQLLVQPEYD